MAEDFAENEYSEAEITKIQALFRGFLARKWINESRDEYEEIFKEVEKDSQTGPIWIYDGPCKPNFQKKASKRKTHRETDSSIRDMTEKSQTIKAKTVTSKQTTICTDLKYDANKICKDTKELCEVGVQSVSHAFNHDFLTVETQTSFCESSISSQDDHKNEQCVQTETETVKHGVLNIQDIPEKYQDPKQTDTSKTLTETIQASNFTEQSAEKFIPDCVTKESAVRQNESSKQTTAYPSIGIPSPTQILSSKGVPSPRGSPAIPFSLGTSGRTNETSVWDSFHNISAPATEPQEVQHSQEKELLQYPQDKESLQEMRKNIAMELLWVQQAINSRKNYLKLKGQIAV